MQVDEVAWQTFFSAAQLVVDASNSAERQLRLQVGSGFNVFDWIDPNENELSDIIGNLLSPKGSHGQGSAFLTLALEILLLTPDSFQPDELEHCTVVREAGTYEGRRLDLLLIFDTAAIGIENKPFAGESPNQLNDYAAWLASEFGESMSLIFLHGPHVKAETLGSKARQSLEVQGRFREIPFYSDSITSLHHWLTRCAEICRSDKVRWFLRDFAEYVFDQFGPVEGESE